MSKPSSVYWGRKSDGAEIWLNTTAIVNAYNEVTTWRKNTFLVPYGKIGHDFIDQLANHINDWNNNSERQHIALTAAIVLLALALQKPSQASKAKDHQECLSSRLALWKEGEIDTLVREGRMIQKRLKKPRGKEPPNKAKIFAKLVFEGQINSALPYLSELDSGGILSPTDDVMNQLQDKHASAEEAQLGSLVYGPIEDIPRRNDKRSGTEDKRFWRSLGDRRKRI